MANVLFLNGINDNGNVRVSKIIDNNVLQYYNQGSCNVYNMLSGESFNSSILTLDVNPTQDINFDNIDLVFNQISDPDSHQISLGKAKQVCDKTSDEIYCINHPDKIVNTSREQLPLLLKDCDNIIVPDTIIFSSVTAHNLKDKINEQNWSYPVLIRKCGDHNASSLVLLNAPEDTNQLHASYFEKPCYLTEFVDYADENGVFTKYRFVSINGNVFLRHVMYSDQWEVHAHVRRFFMKENSEYFDREKDLLANFNDDLAAQIQQPMEYIHSQIGLDFFGVDCSIDAQGRLIIFEANANMNLLFNPYPKPNPWQAQVDAINNALIIMIEQHCRQTTRQPQVI